MNTILVPVDFSGASDAVVAEAVLLAQLVKGRIVLLHAVQQPPVITTDYGMMAYDNTEYMAAAEKSAGQQMARLRAKLKDQGVTATGLELTGLPVNHILEQAKKLNAHYIVIGSHGHTAFYDLLIGSTTSGVLKRATCPVVVVPSPLKGKSHSGGRRK